ncbi:MAG TPA: hypothetical protein VEZ42_15860 [Pseudonocardia sp.]|nr:hypothetical protein [Pseudonocardia sp.]
MSAFGPGRPDALAEFLAGQPTAAARLLAVHVDDGEGRCAGCTTLDRGRVPYPCSLHTAATAARGRRRP